MREKALNWAGNREGLSSQPRLRIYTSAGAHTSVDRAFWVAGIGEANLVGIPATGPSRAMDVAALQAAINADRSAGHLPAGIITCVGSTSVGATDDTAAVMDVAEAEGLYAHVDAAHSCRCRLGRCRDDLPRIRASGRVSGVQTALC